MDRKTWILVIYPLSSVCISPAVRVASNKGATPSMLGNFGVIEAEVQF